MLDSSSDTQSGSAPIGVIAEVHGPVVVIRCSALPPLRQALYASLDSETYLFEVHQHLDERHARAITLHRTAGLSRGMPAPACAPRSTSPARSRASAGKPSTRASGRRPGA